MSLVSLKFKWTDTADNAFIKCAPTGVPLLSPPPVPHALPCPAAAAAEEPHAITSTRQLLAALPDHPDRVAAQAELARLATDHYALRQDAAQVSAVVDKYTRDGAGPLHPEECEALAWYTAPGAELYYHINCLLDKYQHKRAANYLRLAIGGLLRLPPVCRPVWRGAQSLTYAAFVPGDLFLCRRFSSFSLEEAVAREFLTLCSGPGVCLFRVAVSLGGRAIERFSTVRREREVLYPPYSYFRVLSTSEIESGATAIEAEEVVVDDHPRVLLWVDDCPSNNKALIDMAIANGVLVVLKRTTAAALAWLQNEGKVFLTRPHGQFRVITDMDRSKVGDDTKAGLILIGELRALGYKEAVMLYCKDARPSDSLGVLVGKEKAPSYCCFEDEPKL